jgi:predicted dehydrogenase
MAVTPTGKIGVGVIGVGTFGRHHARIYSEHRDVQLRAVADIDRARSREAAEAYGVKGYTRYQELLADPQIQAVSIVVPDMLHREPAVAAARAGKHILLEKPLATTVEDGQAILAAAQDAGVKLMVDFMNRWSPPFALAGQAIRAGELGELQYINIKLNDSLFVPTRMLPWAGQSSVLWFLGSHVVDLVLWLVRAPLEAVSCLERRRLLQGMGIPTADFYHASLEFAGGVVARIENSWILPEGGPTVFELTAEIVGSKGKLDIDTARAGSLARSTGGRYLYPDSYGLVEVGGRMSGFGVAAIDHFIRCVLEEREPEVSAASSLEVTRVVALLQEAARSGTRLRV